MTVHTAGMTLWNAAWGTGSQTIIQAITLSLTHGGARDDTGGHLDSLECKLAEDVHPPQHQEERIQLA